MIANMR